MYKPVTLASGLEKVKGTPAIKQMLDNGYEIRKKYPTESSGVYVFIDLYLNNVNGKPITMQAEEIIDLLTSKSALTDAICEAFNKLKYASGEKIAVIATRTGTTYSDSAIRDIIKQWLKQNDANKVINSVVVHVHEDRLIHVARDV